MSAAEFTGEDDAREDRFAALDTNRDGLVRPNEWRGSAAVFDALDANRDGALTRAEAVGTEGGARDEFSSVDANGDDRIARAEWHWNAAAFERLDTNRDGRLSRQEWDTSVATPLPQQTPAYRAGFERGRAEGIQAGREDEPRGWDLEGQRKLEQADSGYYASLGNRAEYQAGYRTGFRRGYREGFGRYSASYEFFAAKPTLAAAPITASVVPIRSDARGVCSQRFTATVTMCGDVDAAVRRGGQPRPTYFRVRVAMKARVRAVASTKAPTTSPPALIPNARVAVAPGTSRVS